MHNSFHFELLIALGSSSGDRLAMLSQAIRLIADQIGPIQKRSQIYATPPWGGVAKNEFLNATVVAYANVSPGESLKRLLGIEAAMGRIRQEPWSDRNIDLDILMIRGVNDQDAIELTNDTLVVPHPRMLEREFCLVPAAEIAPDWIHPKTGRTLHDELISSAFHLEASRHHWPK